MPAVITGSSVLCPGGRGTEQFWATTRAGISCVGNSRVLDKRLDPIQMALVPEDELEALPPDVESSALPSAARRMLRLAGPALAAVTSEAGPTPLTVYLGLPQPSAEEAPWLEQFLPFLGNVAGKPVVAVTSRIFPFGRAAVLLALEAALAQIEADPAATIVVGGVDSFLDLRRIAKLDDEGRILSRTVMDGFIPGEGAAFFVVKNAAASSGSSTAPVTVLAAASTADEGHRYGTAPNLGEGLSNSFAKLRGLIPSDAAQVGSTFAAFNGEHYEAKSWAVARLRHREFFLPDAVMLHPADVIGDSGAASGALLIALAARSLAHRQNGGSALIWACSDHESRGCALLR